MRRRKSQVGDGPHHTCHQNTVNLDDLVVGEHTGMDDPPGACVTAVTPAVPQMQP